MKHFMNRHTAMTLVVALLGAGGAAAQTEQHPGAPHPESPPAPQQQAPAQHQEQAPAQQPMSEQPSAPAPAPVTAPPAAPAPTPGQPSTAQPPAAAESPPQALPPAERVPVAGTTAQKVLRETPAQAERRVRTPREVSGTVIATKTVRIRGYDQPNFIALIRTNKGNRRLAIDLGPRRDLEDTDIGRGETLAAVGPVVRVGDEQILVATRARIGDQLVEVDRSGQTRAMQEVRRKSQPRRAPRPAPATVPGQAPSETTPPPMQNGQPAPAPMQNGQPPAPAPQAPPYSGPHWNGAGADPAQPQQSQPPSPGVPEEETPEQELETPTEPPPFDDTNP
ncbi:MAG: hypothetical protein DIU78_007620 [Pseudomonadota bacterium]|nr:MAG: hypothetical protein DIU78_02445 [Pseudomonadota bacterium]